MFHSNTKKQPTYFIFMLNLANSAIGFISGINLNTKQHVQQWIFYNFRKFLIYLRLLQFVHNNPHRFKEWILKRMSRGGSESSDICRGVYYRLHYKSSVLNSIFFLIKTLVKYAKPCFNLTHNYKISLITRCTLVYRVQG